MKGYKIPEGWAIGWRNAIERYPKDSEYAWGMNAVLESIEAFPLEELDENPWHTGTPTDEGDYRVALEYDEDITFDTLYWKYDWSWFDDKYKIIAWQKIEEKDK